MLPACCHCSLRAANRPRGLCHSCHIDLAIRGRYAKRNATGRVREDVSNEEISARIAEARQRKAASCGAEVFLD